MFYNKPLNETAEDVRQTPTHQMHKLRGIDGHHDCNVCLKFRVFVVVVFFLNATDANTLEKLQRKVIWLKRITNCYFL